MFLAVGLSFAVWPMLWNDPAASANLAPAVASLSLWSKGVLIALEVLIGYLIGFAASLPMVGMQLGGNVIDQQMGLAAAQLYNPDFDGEAGIIGQLLFLFALSMFIAVGGLNVMLHALGQSFRLIPLGGFTQFDQIVSMIVGLMTITFELALRVAAPLLCLMFLVSVGMGFLMRTVPQINILSVGFSIRILSCVVVMMVLVAAMAGAFEDVAGEMMNRLLRFFQTGPVPAVFMLH